MLAERRQTDRLRAIDDLDRFLDEAEIVLIPVDVAQRDWRCGRASGLAAAWVMAAC